MKPLLLPALALGITGLLACLPTPASAQGAWLDEPAPATWNTPGMSVPAAPEPEDGAMDARCREQARAPTSAEERAVAGQGWDLVGPRHGDGGVVVLTGTAGYDGMCRWWEYQAFVFVNGAFAGTLSPRPMNSRTDGALHHVSVQSSRNLTARYTRYTEADPLCCPSRTTTVQFEVETTPGGPVVRPISTSTSPNR
ncbi:MAG TPA: LppP/LprE family lipoprotein [Longimicrobiales bacterium]